MIAVLADDFSGAAELAGIAAARGFKAEVQTVFDPSSDADVIAVDTDTRLKSATEAAWVVGEVARVIAAAKPSWIYKKTDSVLRGHVRVEIEAILAATGQADCLFIPANPSKGRIIHEGRYLVNGVRLEETFFSQDPDYPRRSSNLRDLLGDSSLIRIPDVSCVDDLKCHVGAATLAAGAADFFTELIGGEPVSPIRVPTCESLLLCGSLTAWDTGRQEEMLGRGFVVKTIADPPSPGIWQSTTKLMLAIGRLQNADVATLIERLVEMAIPLMEGRNDLLIGLEGGATAMAFIRRMGWTRFGVVPEGHVGVGSLLPAGGPLLRVKPGSYPWPEACFAD